MSYRLGQMRAGQDWVRCWHEAKAGLGFPPGELVDARRANSIWGIAETLMSTCVHCKRRLIDHAAEKCLFLETSFEEDTSEKDMG